MAVEELGAVTAPAGELVLIDFGLLGWWATGPADGAAVDMEIFGDDAVAAGRATDLAAVAGRYVLDVPVGAVDEMRERVTSRCRELGFRVRVEPVRRLTNRTRVARLLDDSPDGVEVPFGGPWAVAVRGLPADRPLPVRGIRMPDDGPDRGRWQSVWVEVDERAPARTEDVGYVLVDEARLAFADPDALTAWRTGDPVDGLADLAFWGRDAEVLAARIGAGRLDDGTYGWKDLPVDEAVSKARGLEARELRFAHEVRPHDDHYRLLSLARKARTGSASIGIGERQVCGFFTSWGDGAFPVRRDVAADGTLCRLRVELGAPEIVARQRALDDRWFGELSRLALVSRRVVADGAPIRWMYRGAPDNPDDSGWRIFAGDESDAYVDDPGNVAVVPLRDLVTRDPAIEALVRTPAPAAFERDAEGTFAAVQPPGETE
jgi:hypothetical protein